MKKDRLDTCQCEKITRFFERTLPKKSISQPIWDVGIVCSITEIHIGQETLRQDRAEFAECSGDAVAGAPESSWKEFSRKLTISLFS